jgi:hypothetical protein
VQRAVIDQERKDNIIQTYIKDSTLPYVDVEVKNVVLDDLRQSPYSARIEFEKVYTNPADHTELKRERWTASVTYVFRENVKNNELAVNPSVDHRALPGRPGVQLRIRTESRGLSMSFLAANPAGFSPPVPVPCRAGERGPFDAQRTVANCVLLAADMPTRIGLRLRRASAANVPMTTLLWRVSAVMYPVFARSPLRGSSGALRHSVFCFASRPFGVSVPPKTSLQTGKERRANFFRSPSEKADLRHLGAGPTR